MTENLPATTQRAITLRDYLQEDRIKDQLASAMPTWMNVDRLLRVVFGAAMKNPKILECSRESILKAVMDLAQLGVEPILGRAYLVPYWNNKARALEAQMQIGYQGLVDLARRSGAISDVWGSVVYDADDFNLDYGLERDLYHRPWYCDKEKRDANDPGDVIGAYVVWQLKDGTKHPEFMPVFEIYKRRSKSQAYNFAETGDPKKGGGKRDSIWHVWHDDMCVKTVLKHSSKLVPASIEFMQAVELDSENEVGLQRVDPDLPKQVDYKPDEKIEELKKAVEKPIDDHDCGSPQTLQSSGPGVLSCRICGKRWDAPYTAPKDPMGEYGRNIGNPVPKDTMNEPKGKDEMAKSKPPESNGITDKPNVPLAAKYVHEVEEMRKTAIYKDFDPIFEPVGKRYVDEKKLRMMDLADTWGLEMNPNWTGAQMHQALKDEEMKRQTVFSDGEPGKINDIRQQSGLPPMKPVFASGQERSGNEQPDLNGDLGDKGIGEYTEDSIITGSAEETQMDASEPPKKESTVLRDELRKYWMDKATAPYVEQAAAKLKCAVHPQSEETASKMLDLIIEWRRQDDEKY